MSDREELEKRSSSSCELCQSKENLNVFHVSQKNSIDSDPDVLICSICTDQIEQNSPLDDKHWMCLHQSMWSQVPAVQVLAWRMLSKLEEFAWARDLKDQLYLEDEILSWAQEENASATLNSSNEVVVDSNGTPLAQGDSVTLIKDLDVKGGGFVAKRGTLVKNISLTGEAGYVEGKVNKISIMLKTVFLKKA